MKGLLRLSPFPSGIELQTLSLFALDGLANLTDFGFHFWMGRVLLPAEFAVLQTLNSVLLVYVTASGVFQPVVGRYVAEARGRGNHAAVPAIFQSFFRTAAWLGLGLAILIYLLSHPIAQLLNLPGWTVQISAAIVFFGTVRPVAIGALQGQERFLGYGFSRFFTALGRLAFALLFIIYGFGLRGALVSFPLGWLVGLSAACLFLGKSIWVKSLVPVRNLMGDTWRLSVAALFAYFAFMSLASIDLVWVNRTIPGESAGAYASLVLFRRIVTLLPGVAVVVMFPRIAKALVQGRLPDRLLFHTALIIVTACGALTGLYFIFGEPLVTLLFGDAYLSAIPLLGWMGVATTGVSLSSIWLNYYLVHKPGNFLVFLMLAVALEWLLLNLFPATLLNAVISFGVTGWLLAFCGLCLYYFKHRKELGYA